MLGIEQKTDRKQVFMPSNLPSKLPIIPVIETPTDTRQPADRAHPNARDCRTRPQNVREEKVHDRSLKRSGKT